MTSQTLSDMNSSVIEAKTFMEQASTMQLLESGTAPEILRVLKRSTVLNHSIIVNGYFRRELLVTPIPDIAALIAKFVLCAVIRVLNRLISEMEREFDSKIISIFIQHSQDPSHPNLQLESLNFYQQVLRICFDLLLSNNIRIRNAAADVLQQFSSRKTKEIFIRGNTKRWLGGLKNMNVVLSDASSGSRSNLYASLSCVLAKQTELCTFGPEMRFGWELNARIRNNSHIADIHITPILCGLSHLLKRMWSVDMERMHLYQTIFNICESFQYLAKMSIRRLNSAGTPLIHDIINVMHTNGVLARFMAWIGAQASDNKTKIRIQIYCLRIIILLFRDETSKVYFQKCMNAGLIDSFHKALSRSETSPRVNHLICTCLHIHHLIDIPPLIGGLLNLFYSDSYMAATLLLVIITKWSPQMKKLCIEQNGIDKICIFLMHHDHSHSAVHDALTCVVSLLQLAADPSDGTLISPYLKPALERHLEYQHKKYTHYIQTQQNPYFGNNFRGDEEQAILDAIQIIKKRL